jgi:SAM-dependent methyltransferase
VGRPRLLARHGLALCLAALSSLIVGPRAARGAVPELAYDHAKAIAPRIRKFLDQRKFDQSFARLFGANYKLSTAYDDPRLSTREGYQTRLRDLVAERAIDEKQRQMLGFFVFGEWVEKQALFDARDPSAISLWEDLKRAGMALQSSDGRVRLNELTVGSRTLKNKRTLYFIADAPRQFRAAAGEPSALMSLTGNVLLHALEDRYPRDKLSGVVADFGSGTGIQAIALLALYPKINKVFALDIDSRSLKLSELNAAINGVADRFEALHNDPPGRLKERLAGKKLDYVVSNPPFNIVPAAFQAKFPVFGYGGTDGLDVTRIFLKQAEENLKEGGRLFLFSSLAQDASGATALEKELKSRFATSMQKLKGGFGDEAMELDAYSSAIAGVVCVYYPEASTESLRQRIKSDLKKADVHSIGSYFVQLEKGVAASGGKVSKEAKLVGKMPELAR